MLRELAGRGAIGLIALAGIVPAWAQGAVLTPGLYQLFNHPEADATPPPYGARLDELYDATLGVPDDFTFDFDHPSSFMRMLLEPTTPGRYTVTIFGVSWGGRDIGASHANDQYLGVYEFFFEFLVGAKDHYNGDDDIIVDPTDFTDAQGAANTGWVKTPLGDTVLLADDRDGVFSFRLGDEDNDQGHRDVPGISGWGWLRHAIAPPLINHPQSDWIFTAVLIPSPAPVAWLAIASLAGVPRRQRRR